MAESPNKRVALGGDIQRALQVLVAVQVECMIIATFLPQELGHFAVASSKTHKPSTALTIIFATKLRINVGTMLQERLADLTPEPIIENKIGTYCIGQWLQA